MSYEIKEETSKLLQEKDFHLMTIHTGMDVKAFVLANENENISRMDYKRIILLSLEYINDSEFDETDLNNTIVASVKSYYDSDEYKNGLCYAKTIKK